MFMGVLEMHGLSSTGQRVTMRYRLWHWNRDALEIYALLSLAVTGIMFVSNQRVLRFFVAHLHGIRCVRLLDLRCIPTVEQCVSRIRRCCVGHICMVRLLQAVSHT